MQQVGRYQIVGELGRGAMGVVYRAQDPAIGRTIAIKTIRLKDLSSESERERLRDHLFREAQSAGVLSHPGIVTIYDIAESDGLAFIFMEFVNGPSLEALLSAKPPPDKGTLLSILRQMAEALDYAHRRGIVHRDIKPANVMVHEDGSAKITDFGVAKIMSQELTQTGTVMGTPNYMSPEQIQGSGVSGQTDQYALAVMIYELLTGEKPFSADHLPTLMFKVLRDTPRPLERLNTTLSEEVSAVVLRGLAKAPEDRYPTCTDFVQALAGAFAQVPDWIPLPRGASQDLPTVGPPSGQFPQVPPPSGHVPGAQAGGSGGGPVPPGPPGRGSGSGSGSGSGGFSSSDAGYTVAFISSSPAGSSGALRPPEIPPAPPPAVASPPPPVLPAEPPPVARPDASGRETAGRGQETTAPAVPIPVRAPATSVPHQSTPPPVAAPAHEVPASAAGGGSGDFHSEWQARREAPPSNGPRNIALAALLLALVGGGYYFYSQQPAAFTASDGTAVAREGGSAGPQNDGDTGVAVAAGQANVPPDGVAGGGQASPAPASNTPEPQQAAVAAVTPPPATATKAPITPPETPPAPVAAKAKAPVRAAPASGTFELTTSPRGATATFDNDSSTQCRTPCTLTLSAGRHTFRVEQPGFRNSERIINIPEDTGLIVDLVQMTGTLSLLTQPAGLAVFIDGLRQPRPTPITVRLPVGQHRVEVVNGNERQAVLVDITESGLLARTIQWQ